MESHVGDVACSCKLRVTKTCALSLCPTLLGSINLRVKFWDHLCTPLLLWNTPCWLSSNIILIINPLLSIAFHYFPPLSIIYDIFHYFPSLRMQETPIIMWFDHINIKNVNHIRGISQKELNIFPQKSGNDLYETTGICMKSHMKSVYKNSNHPSSKV